MYCPKHPTQKMTLLFVNYVCDICKPPKSVEPPAPVKLDVKVDVDTPMFKAPNGGRTPLYKDRSWGEIYLAQLDNYGYVLCEQPGCTARAHMAIGMPSYLLKPGMPDHIHDITCVYGHQNITVLKDGDLIEDSHSSTTCYRYVENTQTFSVAVRP